MFKSIYSMKAGMIFCFLLLFFLPTCKKPYAPPAITASNNYLVVDGVINSGTNAVTTINLNRTRNLADTSANGIPELNANISIVSSNGTLYPLHSSPNPGTYSSDVLTLDNSQQYGLAVMTADGKKYQSDFVNCEQTPAIDSVYWRQPFDLTVYVDTHDPTGNSRYYRWQYAETWAHDAQLQTVWRVENGIIMPVDSSNQRSHCWTTQNSTDILLSSTQNLGSDIVQQFPLTKILNEDPRIDKKYSILVDQYAITADAYNYWQVIQKTSQKLGTFFDLQPSELNGNIHSVTNPGEPVIGFLSACSIREQRIFIFNSSLTDWHHNAIIYSCDTLEIPVNQTDYRIYSTDHPGFAPYYFITNGPLVLATNNCLDCTLLGGTNVQPAFWQ